MREFWVWCPFNIIRLITNVCLGFFYLLYDNIFIRSDDRKQNSEVLWKLDQHTECWRLQTMTSASWIPDLFVSGLSNTLSFKIMGILPCCACGCINMRPFAHHLFLPASLSLSPFCVCVMYLYLSSLGECSFHEKEQDGNGFKCLKQNKSNNDYFLNTQPKPSCTC